MLAEAVLDILSRASHCFLLNGKRLLMLVQSDDPRLSFPKLGGRLPQWNRGEWHYGVADSDLPLLRLFFAK